MRREWYADGRIFASCGNFGLALKLPPERCAALIAKNSAGPLRYFPNGHVKKSYAVLPKRTIVKKSEFGKLIDESLPYVSNLSKRKA